MTAVEFLIGRWVKTGTLRAEDMSQAKAMEKEQIMNANSCGFSDGINHEKDIPVNFISCEQYYNETYKSEGRKVDTHGLIAYI